MNAVSENKKFYKLLFSISLPIILQEMVNALVNMVDTFMIGRLGGSEITAVGLANQVFFIFILIIFGVNSGSSIFMSQFWGKKDEAGIAKVIGICMSAGFAVSILFGIAGVFFPHELMSIYSKDEYVIQIGAEYLIWVAPSYLLTPIAMTFMTALKSIGQTKIPMVATIISLIVNVVLNALLIFGLLGFPQWGVMGAAVATSIARAVQTLFLIIIVYHYKMPIAKKIRDYFRFDFKFLSAFFKTTIFVVFNEALWGIGTSMYNVAYKYTDTYAQTAVQISATVQNLFAVLSMGVGTACGIILGNLLGANDLETARKYSKNFIVLTALLGAVMGILLIVFSPLLFSLFEVEPIVRDYGFKIAIVLGATLAVRNINFTVIVGILRSGGDTAVCLFMDIFSLWAVGVPLAFLGALVFKLDIYWIVALASTEELTKVLLSMWRYKKGIWIKNLV